MAESGQRVAAEAPSAAERADDLLDQLRRERADFTNYRRRVERERAEDGERARAETVQRLLPVLDELERALAHAPADLAPHPWVRGVALIHPQVVEALRQLGLERVGAVGEPFDPAHHEAVTYQARPDASERRVAAVARAGYRLGNRLLRPAQVEVVGPAEGGAGEEGAGAEPSAEQRARAGG